jgi:1,2-diacylglycerol 3-beta-glucosyltransferase
MVVITAVATAAVLLMGAYLVLTVVLALRPRPPVGPAPADLWWVVVVPALDEERVLRTTLDSITAIEAPRVRALVVDDGSSDATAEIAASYPRQRVWLLRRQPPEARQGKGAALNEAYRLVRQRVEEAGIDPAHVIVGIVDGDGRVDPDVVERVGPCFADPTVGAVQLQVRIYNRAMGWLARFQDYEFLTFSTLTQRAREHLGSVGLGGNGQFSRLAALDAVAEPGTGPWSDCLTEDLDLGVRLAMAGWSNRFTSATEVRQQGLVSVSSVVRQRTRWMQGHFQCWRHIPALLRSSLPGVTVLDLLWYLAAPAVSLVVSVVFGLATVVLAASVGLALLTRGGLALTWWLVPLYLLSFGPALVLSLAYRRQAGDIGLARALAMAHLLCLYNVVWYAATWRALGRVVLGRHGWVKTARVAEAAT